MKKIILVSIILILTLGFLVLQALEAEAACAIDCIYSGSSSNPTNCQYDIDPLTSDNRLCTVGDVTESGALITIGYELDPCIDAYKTKGCRKDACPSFNYQNGAECKIIIASGALCGTADITTGVWDANEGKCITCGDGTVLKTQQENSVCGDGSGIYVTAGACAGTSYNKFESACGASPQCDEQSVGCIGSAGFCDSNGIYNNCPGNDCMGGTCPGAIPEPPGVPTLPDTEFCKDVDYCIDITVLKDGTNETEVIGCTSQYCQDITIKNEDCAKASGTFSGYATTEIPVCPEKVESADVGCLGLPPDFSGNIAGEYKKFREGVIGSLSIIQDVAAQPVCTVDSVKWDRSDAWDGETVNVNAKTSNCVDGTTMNLEIYQNDPIIDDPAPGTTWPVSITITGNSAKYTWVATWMDDGDFDIYGWPEYYAEVVGPTNTVDSDDMTVHTCMRVDWDRKQAYNEEEVNMVVRVTDKCIGKAVKFDIQEWNSLTPNTVMESNYGETTLTKEIKVPWKAKWMSDWPDNPPEFIFYAKIPDFGSNYIENSSLMTVSKCIKKAEWSEESVDSGSLVSLSVETSDACKNKDIEITICEDDGLDGGDCRSGWSPDDVITTINGVVDSSGKYTAEWTAILQEDSWGEGKSSEFYFIATVRDGGDVIDEKASDILKVYNCIKKVYWSAGSAFEGDDVDLVVETSSSCDGYDVEFEIWEDVSWWTDEDITTISGPAISEGKSQVKWTVTRPQDNPNDILEYYFIVKIKDLSGNDYDEAESERLTINPCIKDGLVLCEHMKKGVTETVMGWFGLGGTEGSIPEYIIIDANKYFRLARKEYPDIDQTKHWIIDRNKYTIANAKSCEKDKISRYTIIDNAKYLDNISKTYGNEKFYKKFVEMYGHPYADYLYCYKTVLKDTQWCQDLSREWYGLENNSIEVIDEKYIDETKKWNYYQDINEMPAKSIFKDSEYKSSVIFEDAWTKVFTVAPLIDDTRNYLEWTKTGDGNAYAGWGFDRKSICGASCDASTSTNAAAGCREKSSECDNCEGGACGDCTKASTSCPGGSGDCYKPCKVDERSGVIIDAELANSNPGYSGVSCGGYNDYCFYYRGSCHETCYDPCNPSMYYCPYSCTINNYCPSGYSCADSGANLCAKCPDGYDLLPLTMYNRATYGSGGISYPKAYKCIADGQVKGTTTFSIRDANVPDGVQPTVIPAISTSSNIKQIIHPAFKITETGNLPYKITSITLTKNGDVYTLTEFYKPDSSYNKERFEIDADTVFNYTILPGAGKLQIEVNHTYTTSYVKDTYYAACGYGMCQGGCGCGGCSCKQSPSIQYNYNYRSCGGTTEFQSCGCGGCCCKCCPKKGPCAPGCGMSCSSTYRDERTTEILNDEVKVSERWGFPLIWAFTTAGPVGTSPAVAYGKVFVNSGGKLYALNEYSGNKIWEFSLSSSMSSPTAADDMVFVGSGNGILYAIDENTGAQKWSWTVPGDIQINTKPAVDKGRVFFGSDDGKVYALDESTNEPTGNKFWEYTTGGAIKSSPTIAEDMVFVGSDDNKVYALDEFSGEWKWEFATSGAVKSSPTVADGVVFIGSDDGKVYALNAYNGIQIWSYTTGGAVRTKPAVHDYKVFVGSMDKKVYTIDRYDGTLIRSYTTTGIILSSPAVAYNRIFVGSNDHNFYALDEDNSNLVWNYDAGGIIQSSPAIDKGMIFFGSDDKKVYALSAGIFPAHENVPDDARIRVEGVIDRYLTNTGFYGETVIGEINITIDPDIVGSFILGAECAFLMYTSQEYPAEHKLIAKESSAGVIGKSYGFNESYGYELTEFGYLEQCRKTCPLKCNCYSTTTTIPAEDWNRLLPKCTEFSEEGESITKIRTDCACLPDGCYSEPCKSNRTFHEEEGSYIANGDFENGLYSWNIVSGTAETEFGGVSGYKLKLKGEISQDIPSLSTNPANEICLDYWINENNPGSFKLTAVVDGTVREFPVWSTAVVTCSIPAGWNKFCTQINGIISKVGLKSDIEVFVDNVNLGKYYDFVELKTFSPEDVEIMDEKISSKNSFGGISFDDIVREGNTYSLKFSTTQLPYTVFNDATITLITHFRNITIPLFPASADVRENPYVNVELKKPTLIIVTGIDPGYFNLKPGTQVTIHLLVIDLETKEPIPNGKVIAIDECGNEETLITDSNGETTFTTTVQNMGNCANKIRFVFMGS